MEDDQRKTENYLLFVPSLVTRKTGIDYSVAGDTEGRKPYRGVQTNEAVTKYLIDLLGERGERLHKIIMLCSPEVSKDKKEFIGGKTSYDYYCDKIRGYLAEHFRDAYPQIEFVPIEYIQEDNEDSDAILRPLIKVLATTDEERERIQKNVYIDFTGGIRSAALTLVFACRILQASGIEVEKILYSKIIGEDIGVIEECTKTYHLFDHLAAQMEQRYGEIEQSVAYTKKELGGNRQILDILEEYRNVRRAIMANQYDQAVEKARSVLGKIDRAGLALPPQGEQMIENIKSEAKEIAKNRDRLKLYILEEELGKNQDRDAVITYRETILPILFESKIMDFRTEEYYGPPRSGNRNNRRTGRNARGGGSGRVRDSGWDAVPSDKKNAVNNKIANEILAAYVYYADPRSKAFIGTAKDYLRKLKEDKTVSPQTCKQEQYGEEFRNPYNYINQPKIVNGYDFGHNRDSRSVSINYLRPYVEARRGRGTNVQQSADFRVLDRVYTRYGYPFACTYDKTFCAGYEELYKQIFEEGVTHLENCFRGRDDDVIKTFGVESYEELLQKLCDGRHEEWVRTLFPFRLKQENIFPHRSNTVLTDEKKWDDFIYEFAKGLYRIKDVRNKVGHRNQLSVDRLDDAIKEIGEMLKKINEIMNGEH